MSPLTLPQIKTALWQNAESIRRISARRSVQFKDEQDLLAVAKALDNLLRSLHQNSMREPPKHLDRL